MTPYVRRVLERFRTLPTATGKLRTGDRLLAEALERERVPLADVEAALHLAALRRLRRPATEPPLPPIRSLHYVTPILEEIRNQPLPTGYLEYLEQHLAREIQPYRS